MDYFLEWRVTDVQSALMVRTGGITTQGGKATQGTRI